MKVETVFKDGEMIPKKYTCDGKDISPEIKISDIDSEAESLAIIVDDPDAPGNTFDHWLIWNIPTDLKKIPEEIPQQKAINDLSNSRQGRNGFGGIGYRGPCPPGETHEYKFKFYALETDLDLAPGAPKKDLVEDIQNYIIDKTIITGKYGR